MGLERPKQYLPLGGRCVIEWSINCFLAQPDLLGMVIVLAEDDQEFANLTVASDPRVHCCVGGAERALSVLAGLKALLQSGAGEQDWVMVHDAARPGLDAQAISRLRSTAHAAGAHAATQKDGAILALPVADTLKRAVSAQNPSIAETVDRKLLWQAQTPQYFPIQMLHHALSQALAADAVVTDEASAMEYMGAQPALVMGDPRIFKITLPGDLALAEQLLVGRSEDSSPPNTKAAGNPAS